MEFNRFDICTAYYHFAMLPVNAQSKMAFSYEFIYEMQWAYQCQLKSMRYKPGLSDSQLATISPNARAIYMNLIHKYLN